MSPVVIKPLSPSLADLKETLEILASQGLDLTKATWHGWDTGSLIITVGGEEIAEITAE